MVESLGHSLCLSEISHFAPGRLLSIVLIEVESHEFVLFNSKRSSQTPPQPFWHISTFSFPRSTSTSSDWQAGHFMVPQASAVVFIVSKFAPCIRRENKIIRTTRCSILWCIPLVMVALGSCVPSHRFPLHPLTIRPRRVPPARDFSMILILPAG